MTTPALARATKDVPGGRDHPLVSRYPGAIIQFHESQQFDRYDLRVGKIAAGDRSATARQGLEGKVTRLVYLQPKEVSALEVFRNYWDALVGAGFKSVFSCEREACGEGFSGSYPNDNVIHVRGWKQDQSYFAGVRSDATGEVHVAVFVVKTGDGPYARVDIVESKPMRAGLVTVSAAKMQADIDTLGKAVIHAVYFDSGRATLKPESAPALLEMAKLFKAQPALSVFVVGHTDDQGGDEPNLALSRRRAETVVSELAAKHGVARARLHPRGVGLLCPVASNGSETGRAANRRVELVKR
jgi:outer membrane protein OmpA-like peptidoglycan-associated protein